MEKEDQDMESEIPFFQRVILGIILATCVVSNAAIVVRIVKANWKQFRPLNVYQINYFTGLALVTLTGMILVLSKNNDSVDKICPTLIFSYFLNINNTFDIVILQLDRLLAVSKPLLYKTEVDATLAVTVVALSKLFSLGITIIGSIIDPVFIFCPACERCIYVHSVNVYTVAYPSLGAFILTMVVSVYVSIMANSLNSIQPMVNLPLQSQSQRINVIPLRNERLTLTFDGWLGNQSIQNHAEVSGENSTRKNTGKASNPGHQFQFPTGSMGRKMRRNAEPLDEMNITNLVRQIEQTEVEESRSLKIETSPSNSTNENCSAHRLMLKKTLKMNLLTLALLFTLLPIQILTIIYENCNDAQGECDTYFNSMLVISVLQICVGFLHPLVVLIILEQQ